MYNQPQIVGFMAYCISTTKNWTAPLQTTQDYLNLVAKDTSSVDIKTTQDLKYTFHD